MHQKCEAQSGIRVIFTPLRVVWGIISMILDYIHCFYGYSASNVFENVSKLYKCEMPSHLRIHLDMKLT